MLHTLATAAKSKMVIAAAAASIAAGGGVAAKAAITGNANPLDWGHTVQQAVIDCKANLVTGEHAIGQCVSTVAKQNGAAQRTAHSQAGDHGPGDAGHSVGPSSHPTGPPALIPSGPPSTHPSGPPTTITGPPGTAPTGHPSAS